MIHYSVLVPQRDAVPEVRRLLGELSPVLAGLGKPYEVLAIDDGSQRSSRQALRNLLAAYPSLRVLVIDRPAGMSAALCVGIAAARGEVLVAIEASGQYPAAEIERLVARLARVDAVFGCRRKSRAAKIARYLVQVPRWLLWGLEVRDPKCLFWAARHEAVEGLILAPGAYRLLSTLVSRRGYRVGELHVDHRPAARRARRRGVWSSPAELWAAWRPARRQPYRATEIFAPSEDPALRRVTRFDPPQPLERRGQAAPDAPQSDRRNTAS